MEKVLNIYETLNERERYILETLEVRKEWFDSLDIDSVLSVMRRMKERISQLPITRKQLELALNNYEEPHDKIFEGITFIKTVDDFPDVKVNMFEILSEENRKIVEKLGVKVEDKEITSIEYYDKLHVLVNKLLIKYRNWY